MADTEFAHPVFTHRDGTKCILIDGEWFVPLDAGGEGYACQQEHPIGREKPALQERIAELEVEVARYRSSLARAWSAYLELALETKLDKDDNMSILEYVILTDIDLRNRLRAALTESKNP